MTTIFHTLRQASSGLNAHQRAVNRESENVSHAYTPGYTKKTHHTFSSPMGVKVGDPIRNIDGRLLQELNQRKSGYGYLSVHHEFSQQLQGLWGQPGSMNGLHGSFLSLGRSIQTLQSVSKPSITYIQNFLNRAEDVASGIRHASQTVQTSREDADKKIQTTITSINQTLESIHSLNISITRGFAHHHDVSTLQDQREQHIASLSQMIQIRTHQSAQGSLHIDLDSGENLLGTHVSKLEYTPRPALSSSAFYRAETHPDGPGNIAPIILRNQDITEKNLGGELGALIQIRDQNLHGVQKALDQLAHQTSTTLNHTLHQGASLQSLSEWQSQKTFANRDTPLNIFEGHFRIATIEKNTGMIQTTHNFDGDALFADAHTVGTLIDGINAQNETLGIQAALENGHLVLRADREEHGLVWGQVPNQPQSHVISDLGFCDLLLTNAHAEGEGAASTLRLNPLWTEHPESLPHGILNPDANINQLGIAAADPRLWKALSSSPIVPFAAQQKLPAFTGTPQEYMHHIINTKSLEARSWETHFDDAEESVETFQTHVDNVRGVNIDEAMMNLINFQMAYNASSQTIQVIRDMLRTLENMMR